VAEIAGLKLIVPSSVAGSGVSVSASGKVTFTAATSVSVNGVFSTTYDNYLIVMRNRTNSTTGYNPFQLRLSGTNATGSNYTSQRITADSTSVSAARSSSETSARLIDGVNSTTLTGTHVYLYGPALAQPTAMRSVGAGVRSSAWLEDFAATHSLSTAYDGFSFQRDGSDTLTGALCVYGLAQ
jgi:hypothetical protein